MTDDSELLAVEYTAVRNRIDKDIDAINAFEIFSISATGFLFYFGIEKENYYDIAMLAVYIVAIYGFFRYLAYRNSIKIAERYLKCYLEGAMRAKTFHKGQLWASYYDSQLDVPLTDVFASSFKGGPLKISRNLLWAALFSAAAIHSLISGKYFIFGVGLLFSVLFCISIWCSGRQIKQKNC